MIRAIGKKITPAISVPFRKQSSATAIHVEPTKADRIIADVAARTTEPRLQKLARGLAWGADEKVWLALTSVAWLVTRGQSSRVRATTTHALLVTVAASALPHALKAIFDQTRPDRTTLRGHLHGVAPSGHAQDAFPSGHALHMGALYSAAGPLPARARIAVRSAAVGLSITRVMLLAHWASDVVVGFMLGAALERSLRPWTGYEPPGASRT
ncbi:MULTISPECIES: phosphatase PAP2 family protein [unclassified Bradyrhizobium]|uniref:phosphatase PAP2 family protein n=1 Tax=unclassified Bradyrhizobium TaxID=2631580 RepID=UPI0028EBFB49|nr:MULTISPECIES: phosphatase PAP2 family protein [unclassified Bradyrhizobium]